MNDLAFKTVPENRPAEIISLKQLANIFCTATGQALPFYGFENIGPAIKPKITSDDDIGSTIRLRIVEGFSHREETTEKHGNPTVMVKDRVITGLFKGPLALAMAFNVANALHKLTPENEQLPRLNCADAYQIEQELQKKGELAYLEQLRSKTADGIVITHQPGWQWPGDLWPAQTVQPYKNIDITMTPAGEAIVVCRSFEL